MMQNEGNLQNRMECSNKYMYISIYIYIYIDITHISKQKTQVVQHKADFFWPEGISIQILIVEITKENH